MEKMLRKMRMESSRYTDARYFIGQQRCQMCRPKRVDQVRYTEPIVVDMAGDAQYHFTCISRSDRIASVDRFWWSNCSFGNHTTLKNPRRCT